MQKVKITKAKDLFLASWNQEFQKTYPITKRMMQEYAIDSHYVIQEESYIILDQGTYVGMIVVKDGKDSLESYQDILFVSLLHVDKAYRQQGIATKMLQDLEQSKEKYHKKSLYVGGDMECFFPGVFVLENPMVHQFFLNFGFIKVYESYNLWTNKRMKAKDFQEDITFHIAKTQEEKENILSCIKTNFSYRWYVDSLGHTTTGFVYAKQNNHVVGFVKCARLEDQKLSHGLNTYMRYQNLAAIGPLGVIAELRNKRIGKSLVIFAVEYLFTCGASDVIVDWTGLIDFYQKCGFTRVCDTFILYKK